jgi:peptidoglycan/LPS O-acetylase OafA/YrhL
VVQKEGLYRADIDGLRALAVVSVILYHTGFIFDDRQLFKGGFIGVDIFLVISGYLIASILLREYRATGRINLGLFYAKRVKRIVPPVLLVMFFSVLPAWQFLLPEQFVDYSNSILYSLLFSVNIYWDVTLHEYGVESTYLKPMLHLWSLSLEE